MTPHADPDLSPVLRVRGGGRAWALHLWPELSGHQSPEAGTPSQSGLCPHLTLGGDWGVIRISSLKRRMNAKETLYSYELQGIPYWWSKSFCLWLLKYVFQWLLKPTRGSPDMVYQYGRPCIQVCIVCIQTVTDFNLVKKLGKSVPLLAQLLRLKKINSLGFWYLRKGWSKNKEQNTHPEWLYKWIFLMLQNITFWTKWTLNVKPQGAMYNRREST